MVRTIEIDDATFQVLMTSASVLSAVGAPVTPGEVVARLVQQQVVPQVTPASTPTNGEAVAIHYVYKGQRNEGLFAPKTSGVRLTAGPLAGRSFGSPSMAAVAVVRALNPSCAHPERNGWRTWVVNETGKPLQSIRHSGS